MNFFILRGSYNIGLIGQELIFGSSDCKMIYSISESLYPFIRDECRIKLINSVQNYYTKTKIQLFRGMYGIATI